jgi:lipopolysaccharide transport system permease protein
MIIQTNFLHLLKAKVEADLRNEVSRHYLFYLWWVINPILSMVVYYLVFGFLLQRGIPNYVAFLLVGVTSWQWFAKTIQNGSQSIYQARALMAQVNTHKSFFPLVVVGRNAFKQVFVISLLLIFLMLYPTPVTACWLALPVLIGIQLILVAACTMLCAAFVPFLPDLSYVIETGVHLMFFASGIFYDFDELPIPFHRDLIYYLNPMGGLIKNYRMILINGQWPDWSYLGFLIVFSVFLLCCAYAIITKFNHVYPKVCLQ